MPGPTSLLPTDSTAPSSLGGVPLTNAPGPTSSTNYSVLPGGTDSGSLLNQPITPTAQMTAADNATTTAVNTTVFPAAGYTPPPSLIAPDTFLADWYREGNTAESTTAGTSTLPRMVDDFEDEIAQIYIYGPSTKNGNTSVDRQIVPPFSKFILESIQESHAERSQIVETFGDFYVFLFGERPPIYNFSGTLINTASVNWVADFKYYYDNYLRGTKCVESGARLVITYGGRQVEGFMLGMSTATEASLERGVKMSFQLVVTRKSFIAFSADFGFVVTGGETIGNAKMIELLNDIAGAEGIGTSSPDQSAAGGAVTQAVQQGLASTTSLVA